MDVFRLLGGKWSGGTAEDSHVAGCGNRGGLRDGRDDREIAKVAGIAAFDSGNPLSVARSLHERWPDKAIFIAGDDDHRLENNPGREKALAAAEAVAGVAIFPNFSAEQRAKGLTDFNYLAIQNPELVSRQLDDVLHGVKEQGLAASLSIELAPAV